MEKHACHSIQFNFYAKYPSPKSSIPLSLSLSYTAARDLLAWHIQRTHNVHVCHRQTTHKLFPLRIFIDLDRYILHTHTFFEDDL